MIDIIIPIYNSRKTLENTLSSINDQIIDVDINIYLIDDYSDESYEDIIEKYSNLNINYYKLDENKGPGVAREYGLSKSSGDYIVFLDSDDVFYDNNSISVLYKAITSGEYDVVRSVIYEETDNGVVVWENENIGLHGKIYRREFLNKYDIHFNEYRSNEDVGFNALIRICGANYNDIKDVTYIWCNNKDSITRSNRESYADIDSINYSLNIIWALKQALLKVDQDYQFVVESLLEIYSRYLNASNEDTKKVLIENAEIIFNFINKNNLDNIIRDFSFKERYDSDYVDETIKWVRDNDKSEYKQTLLSDEDYEDQRYHLQLLEQFNSKIVHTVDEYDDLTQKMFGYISPKTEIIAPINATWGCKNVYVGKGTFINSNVTFVDDGKITIGNGVSIGPNVSIITLNHAVNVYDRLNCLVSIKDVNIEDHVWIGAGAIILPGVTIGENSVIGAGSVVTKDVPPNVLAYGNPCKVIKEINQEEK